MVANGATAAPGPRNKGLQGQGAAPRPALVSAANAATTDDKAATRATKARESETTNGRAPE